jgi:hypothetical protein
LNVAERQALGSVRKDEVVDLVKSLLLAQDQFPTLGESNAVYEGAIITRVPTGLQITWQRPHTWDPFTVAESHTEAFTEIDAAVERFIETEWKLGIDGISLD